MYSHYPLVLLSAVGGFFSAGVFLLAGYLLDDFMNPEYANFIALLVGGVTNFILQKLAFTGEGGSPNIVIGKYVASELTIIIFNQLGLVYFIKRKKDYTKKLPKEARPYYTTIARIVVALVVFLFLSFPMRKLWVFV